MGKKHTKFRRESATKVGGREESAIALVKAIVLGSALNRVRLRTSRVSGFAGRRTGNGG